MRTISFQLTMPNVGSWNGRWSGNRYQYFIHRKLKDAIAERVLTRSSYYYNFGDGWGASVKVTAPDAATIRAQRRVSNGFCGYDWMVDSIVNYGKIHGPTCPVPEQPTLP